MQSQPSQHVGHVGMFKNDDACQAPTKVNPALKTEHIKMLVKKKLDRRVIVMFKPTSPGEHQNENNAPTTIIGSAGTCV